MIQERAARSLLPLHSPTRPLAAGTMGRGSGEKSFTMVIMNVETVASLLTQPLGMQRSLSYGVSDRCMVDAFGFF